jgi:hypothetical protein
MTRIRKPIFTALAAALIAIALPTLQQVPASAASDCDLYASSTGNDAASGFSETAAFRTIARLAAQLQPGETGCLTDGSVFEGHRTISGAGEPGAPITIRPVSGGSAAIKDQTLIAAESHDIVFSGLQFAGLDLAKSTMLIVAGDRITFSGNDITSPQTICMDIKKGSDGVLVTGNRIHDCGTQPEWLSSDSGAHGVYIQEATNVTVTQNFIYRNKYRGLQTWPGADGVLIEGNVFFENGTHVNLGYDGATMSRNVTVRNNIMVGATLFKSDEWKNVSSIHGYLPQGAELGNVVEGNCINQEIRAYGLSEMTGYGYTAIDNVIASTPDQFVNAAAGDFRLVEGAACTGYGPDSVQPTTTPTVPAGVTCASASVTVDLAEVGAVPDTVTSNGYWLKAYAKRADGTWATSSWLFTYGGNEGLWEYTAEGWNKLTDFQAAIDTGSTLDGTPVWVGQWTYNGAGWDLDWTSAGTC